MQTKIKELSIEQLLNYYHPEEILGYCSRCSNYGKFWSCPPHDFVPKEYLEQFSFAYVIGVRIPLDKTLAKDEAIAHYHMQKIILNKQLQESKENCPDCAVLIAGHCFHCESCVREKGEECCFPQKHSYSLESLGIKISSIIEQEFNDSLQWQKDKMPESLYVVMAVLAKTQLKGEDIFESLV